MIPRALTALAVAWTVGVLAAAGARAEPPGDDAEPELCREVIEASDEPPLEALRKAETERWQAARTASRQGKRRLRQSMGGSPSLANRRVANQVAASQDAFHSAVREARVLCDCRERRGDPYREDCAVLFRKLEGMIRPRGAPVSSSSPR